MISQADNASRVRDLYDDGGDPPFHVVLSVIGPKTDAEFANLIDIDGRMRIALGRDVTLERYLETKGVVESKAALDAAIEMALRSASRSRMPGRRDVETMVQAYPQFEKLIREAAMLARMLRSTTTVQRQFSRDERLRRLPCEIGPMLPDGRPRYELVELVGEGATGSVYRAVDRNLSDDDSAATVAVKVFSTPEDPALAAWMRDEALKARRVVHENVVRVFDRGDMEGGGSYIVYEYVAGGDLGARIRREGIPMRPRSAARLIAAVARGVQAIHAAGLVHCDLKPGNIALTGDGQPKVADFGIAMREGQSPTVDLTESGTPLGNLGFISPEQFRGEPGAFSFPSDIYALGALLAYLVGGGTEFPDQPVRLEDLPPPDQLQLDRSFDPDLRRMVLRATAVDPLERYGSAGELADDLDRWLQHRPLPWGRTGPYRLASLFVRRRPVLAVMAGVALVALATAAGIKLREDMRRNEATRLIYGAMEHYTSSDDRGENLGVLAVWETLAQAGYFGGAAIPRNSRQVEVLRRLLATPDIAEQPESLDAILLRSALALALVAQEENHLEGEPLAAACREQWAELFGEDDPMARRMAVVAAAAAATRLVAEHEQGRTLEPGAVARARAALEAAAERLPGRDSDGPVDRLHKAVSQKLRELEL